MESGKNRESWHLLKYESFYKSLASGHECGGLTLYYIASDSDTLYSHALGLISNLKKGNKT